MSESWTAEQHAAIAEEMLLRPGSSLERSMAALAHIQVANFKAAAAAMEMTRGVVQRQEQRTEAMLRDAGIIVGESA